MNTHAINWFEIPSTDIDRAATFYESILSIQLRREEIASNLFAIFPNVRPAVNGCVIKGEQYSPSANGTVIYLSCNGLDASLDRTQSAGGSVATPKTALPPGMGFFAHIIDTEGNRVGLHSAV